MQCPLEKALLETPTKASELSWGGGAQESGHRFGILSCFDSTHTQTRAHRCAHAHTPHTALVEKQPDCPGACSKCPFSPYFLAGWGGVATRRLQSFGVRVIRVCMLTRLPSLCDLKHTPNLSELWFPAFKMGYIPALRALLMVGLKDTVKGKCLAECPVHTEVPPYLRFRFLPFQLPTDSYGPKISNRTF